MGDLAEVVQFKNINKSSAAPIIKKADVIDMKSGKKINSTKKDVKYRKDGGIKQSGGNKKADVSSTVYPIKDPEQFKNFINYFDNRIGTARTKNGIFIAVRNYLLVQIGLNSGYRISDIVRLKWNDLIDEQGNFLTNTNKSEKKTSKIRKVFIEQQIKDAVNKFLEVTNINPVLDDYIFSTCRSEHMTENNAYAFIKKAAEEVGIKVKIATHTLRKTFAYWYLTINKEDLMALYTLMDMFGHCSPAMTLKYAGITDDMHQEAYQEIGETYRKILNDEYTKMHTDVVKISKECLMDIIKMAYETGRQDADADLEIHLDNMETFKELIQDYIV